MVARGINSFKIKVDEEYKANWYVRIYHKINTWIVVGFMNE